MNIRTYWFLIAIANLVFGLLSFMMFAVSGSKFVLLLSIFQFLLMTFAQIKVNSYDEEDDD